MYIPHWWLMAVAAMLQLPVRTWMCVWGTWQRTNTIALYIKGWSIWVEDVIFMYICFSVHKRKKKLFCLMSNTFISVITFHVWKWQPVFNLLYYYFLSFVDQKDIKKNKLMFLVFFLWLIARKAKENFHRNKALRATEEHQSKSGINLQNKSKFSSVSATH